jgi:Thioredoxin-like
MGEAPPITWLHDWDETFAAARKADKVVFIDVKKVDCSGCDKLDSETFPNPTVRRAFADRFVALKLDHQDARVRELNVVWLPTLFVADKRGVVHYRSVNSLPPEDLLDVLDLGEAHARIKQAQPEIAERLLTAALARRPDVPLTPELIYWHAIARYFVGNHDHAAREETWRRLKDDYPDSIWTHRIP